eukprot:126426-Rhodomonas_salina.2
MRSELRSERSPRGRVPTAWRMRAAATRRVDGAARGCGRLSSKGELTGGERGRGQVFQANRAKKEGSGAKERHWFKLVA